MKFSKYEVLDELDHIDSEFDFSDTCSDELEDHLIEQGYIEFVEDVPMLTYTGQLAVGFSKQDLQDINGYDEDDGGEEYEQT